MILLPAANPFLQVRVRGADDPALRTDPERVSLESMIERSAYKFRIYPDPAQERLFAMTAGSCRLVYNLCLEQKRLERHRSDPRRLTAFDQIKELPGLKAAAPFLRDVPNHCLQQAVVDLHRAFANFFEGRAGFPKPRRKFENEAFRFPDPSQVKFRDGAVFLPKAKWVRIVAHREIVGKVKTVTVSNQGGHWYAAVQVEREVEEPPVRQGSAVGIDVGVANSVVASDGEIYRLPVPTTGERKRLAGLQKKLARQKRGSRNRAKTLRMIAARRARSARRTRDARHKLTRRIVDRHAVVCHEDLRLKAMTASARGTAEAPGTNVRQKAGLNRELQAQGIGETFRLLAYKAARSGGRVVAVDARNTSRECSACGHAEAANRPSRDVFECVSCGHAACADANASRVVLARGLEALRPTGGLPGMACGSSRIGGRKQEVEGTGRTLEAAA